MPMESQNPDLHHRSDRWSAFFHAPSRSNRHAKHLEKEKQKPPLKYEKSSLIVGFRFRHGGKREN
jgi:hypothetical protein